MNKEILKDLVHPEVYDKVSKAEHLWNHADRVHDTMERLEKAQEDMKAAPSPAAWKIRMQLNGMEVFKFENTEVLSGEIWEATLQFLSLLEAIHYSDRKATIIEFNNSLKEKTDEQNTGQ